MNDDKRKLAELCGIKLIKMSDLDKCEWVTGEPNKAWDPFNNIEQAMMILNKFDMWKLECVDDLYFCQISKLSERCDGYEILGAVQLETLCEAICYACLCAKAKEG